MNLYGPVYSWLQAFLIDRFGLQDIVFRLPNLLAAYLTVLLLALRGIDLVLNGDCRVKNRVLTVAEAAIGDTAQIVAPFEYY